MRKINNMLKDKIKNDIQTSIPGIDVKIFTNDNKYFNAIFITDVFKDKNLLDRQKLIHDIIGEYITSRQIHAISFKTYTNNEWMDENKD